MREQYEYQLGVAEELARAMKMRGKLTTFGVVLHDVDGEVFWLNHNNYQFADELLRLLDQGAEPMAYLGATTDHNLYLALHENLEKCPIGGGLSFRPFRRFLGHPRLFQLVPDQARVHDQGALDGGQSWKPGMWRAFQWLE